MYNVISKKGSARPHAHFARITPSSPQDNPRTIETAVPE